MTMTTPKVEVGFDLTDAGTGPFFRLDDPVKGRLDIISYVLGGTLFYDVTDDVRSISVERGKNRRVDEFDAGLANVVFNNHDRSYDPQNIASPYATQIIPKREIKITVNGEPVFFGIVDDWNFQYDITGDSTASAAASDATTSFNLSTLSAGTSVVETSGARVNAILDDINWPSTARAVDTGAMELGADVIEEGTNALDYLRTVEKSEPGLLFIDAQGRVAFRDRLVAPAGSVVAFTDDGTGIPYTAMQVQYGSELLYNEVILSSVITSSTAIAFDTESIDEYGSFTLQQQDLLVNNDTDLIDLAVWLASKYSAPEYRFEAIDVILNDLTPEQKTELLQLEMGDPVVIKFTPNKVGAQIVKYAQIIRISHSIEPGVHQMSFGFATLDFTTLVLNDAVFGRLDSGNRLSL